MMSLKTVLESVRNSCTGPGTLIRTTAAALLLATVATQHHLSSFNRVQKKTVSSWCRIGDSSRQTPACMTTISCTA